MTRIDATPIGAFVEPLIASVGAGTLNSSDLNNG
jgi:hypothetical protein